MNLAELQTTGFWYLATPYRAYPHGFEEAFHEACYAAAKLTKAGVWVYCPIAHTHPLAMSGVGWACEDHRWTRLNKPFLKAAVGIIMTQMPGWENSEGMHDELADIQEQGKPIHYMEW